MKYLRNIKSIFALTVTMLLLLNSVAFAAGAPKLQTLKLSKESVTIDQVGASAFIDATAKFDNGTSLDVTKDIDWQSEDWNIAYPYEGRILALGIGKTVVTGTYNGVTEKIKVQVQGPSIRELKRHVIDKADTVSPLSLTSTERQAITDYAYSMTSYQWTPKKDLVGWKGNSTFKAGVVQIGIPYTQTAYQKNKSGFVSSLSNTDFYDYYTRFGIRMPKYGNDCSGFVSFSMGLSRHTTIGFIDGITNGVFPKVGSYSVSDPTKTDLLNSYKKLQPGDAVVNSGHTFLIDYNSGRSIYAYEQTPPYARYTYWSYDDMANGKYMPFSKK